MSSLSSIAYKDSILTPYKQETAQLEHQAYELQQKVDVTAEAKAVLDSWVRYEGQVKARQQQEIADAVMAKVEKELENPKVLDQILKQAVQDVESKCPVLTHPFTARLLTIHRNLATTRKAAAVAVVVMIVT